MGTGNDGGSRNCPCAAAQAGALGTSSELSNEFLQIGGFSPAAKLSCGWWKLGRVWTKFLDTSLSQNSFLCVAKVGFHGDRRIKEPEQVSLLATWSEAATRTHGDVKVLNSVGQGVSSRCSCLPPASY